MSFKILTPFNARNRRLEAARQPRAAASGSHGQDQFQQQYPVNGNQNGNIYSHYYDDYYYQCYYYQHPQQHQFYSPAYDNNDYNNHHAKCYDQYQVSQYNYQYHECNFQTDSASTSICPESHHTSHPNHQVGSNLVQSQLATSGFPNYNNNFRHHLANYPLKKQRLDCFAYRQSSINNNSKYPRNKQLYTDRNYQYHQMNNKCTLNHTNFRKNNSYDWKKSISIATTTSPAVRQRNFKSPLEHRTRPQIQTSRSEIMRFMFRYQLARPHGLGPRVRPYYSNIIRSPNPVQFTSYGIARRSCSFAGKSIVGVERCNKLVRQERVSKGVCVVHLTLMRRL